MADFQAQSFGGSSQRGALGKYMLAGIVGALVACFVMSVFSPASTFAVSAGGPSSADGVFALDANLGSNIHGLYLIDTRNQTILLYRYGGIRSGGLSLLSARNFRYDRELLDFNSGKPSPEEVRELIENSGKSPAAGNDSEPRSAGPEASEAPE